MEEEALEFARQAHGDQKRKYSDEPYIAHPIRVAEMIKTVPHTAEMIVAAYLHDVVEDTEVELDEIQKKFGAKIAKLVDELTDEYMKKNYPHLNRKKRKEKEVERQSQMSKEAKTIKLADVIDNTPDIAKNDRNFARRYVPEMQALVHALAGGDPELFERANTEVMKAQKLLRTPRQKFQE